MTADQKYGLCLFLSWNGCTKCVSWSFHAACWWCPIWPLGPLHSLFALCRRHARCFLLYSASEYFLCFSWLQLFVLTLADCCVLFVCLQDAELLQTTLSPSTAKVESFQLHDRALHVYEEAARVHRCAALAAEGGDTAKVCVWGGGVVWVWMCGWTCGVCSSLHKINLVLLVCTSAQILGQQMTASHMSCSNTYQCSSAELDELTQICRWVGCSSYKKKTSLQQMAGLRSMRKHFFQTILFL